MPEPLKPPGDDTPAAGISKPHSPGQAATGKYKSVEMAPTGRYSPVDREALAAAAAELSSGPTAVPGYDIVGELGRGGMGVIYKAWQVAAKRFVALKMIQAGPDASETLLRRFKGEAEAVLRLDHPNIIHLYEVGEYRGMPFLTLEFCGGGNLAKKLAGNPISAKQAAALTEKLARAVAVAHEQKIIHRDLKPANILLSTDGEPKIGDFGLAKRLDSDEVLTGPGGAIGTPSYMPPEQAEGGKTSLGPAADIYALGAILYECLTGRPPFKGATPVDTLHQLKHQEPVPPRQFEERIPADLEAICLICLRKKPEDRYARAADLADDLQRFLASKPIIGRRRGGRSGLRKWVGDHPREAVLALLLGLAGLSAIVYLILYQR